MSARKVPGTIASCGRLKGQVLRQLHLAETWKATVWTTRKNGMSKSQGQSTAWIPMIGDAADIIKGFYSQNSDRSFLHAVRSNHYYESTFLVLQSSQQLFSLVRAAIIDALSSSQHSKAIFG